MSTTLDIQALEKKVTEMHRLATAHGPSGRSWCPIERAARPDNPASRGSRSWPSSRRTDQWPNV